MVLIYIIVGLGILSYIITTILILRQHHLLKNRSGKEIKFINSDEQREIFKDWLNKPLS